MENKHLVKNAALNTIKTVSGIAFPLITFPYVSRVLGVSSLGVYNFASSIIAYFLLISGLGIPTYAIREGSQYREDKKKIQAFVSEVFSINVISTLIAYVILGICLITIPKLEEYKYAILLLSLEIIATTIGTVWVCNIFEDFKSITIRTICFQIISLCLMFLLVKDSGDLYKYIAIVALSNSGSNFLNFIYIRKKGFKFNFTLNIDWKKHIRPIMVIFSTTVAVTIYVSSDTTMLGFMTTDYHVGLYSTAVKIYTIVKNILSSLLIVMIPRFSLILARRSINEARSMLSTVFSFLTAIMFPIIIGLLMISDDVITLVSGIEYIGAKTALQLLSVAMLFSLYAFMYVQCVLIPAKKEKVVFFATGASAIVNILLNFILIPMYGIAAAAMTTIIAEMLTFLVSFFEGRKIIKINLNYKDFISCFLGSVGIVVVCVFSKAIVNFPVRLVVRLLGSGFIYFSILIILKNETLYRIINTLCRKK